MAVKLHLQEQSRAGIALANLWDDPESVLPIRNPTPVLLDQNQMKTAYQRRSPSSQEGECWLVEREAQMC